MGHAAKDHDHGRREVERIAREHTSIRELIIDLAEVEDQLRALSVGATDTVSKPGVPAVRADLRQQERRIVRELHQRRLRALHVPAEPVDPGGPVDPVEDDGVTRSRLTDGPVAPGSWAG